MENQISASKIELMKEIVSARLTPAELREFTTYIQAMTDKRPQPSDSPSEV
jgi:hypothetical protein